jgi:hypothetical protein
MNSLLAGAIASMAMSGSMRLAQLLGAIGRPPPGIITERVLGTRSRSGTARNTVQNTAAHLGFGAAMGFVFERARKHLPLPLPSPLNGTLFGLLVWATNYEAALPMLQLLPPAHRDQPGRPATMIVAHLIYGSVLELLIRRSLTPLSDATRAAARPRSTPAPCSRAG